ncbi:MAG: isoprenoid biosynthesis glyoxalase ElbB [candidate division KSB1 bacterium]|jgi:enhancing lycopene biosynthesis protein 2|nr:isoprenoid biosynthesis glyoxalase ElbB [candidate division KSB1 bacterium]
MTDFSNKRVGVVLAGSGVFDGSEIHEATITLLELDKAGAKIVCMAPNVPQAHVMDHSTSTEESDEKRNVLVESSRIARGDIRDMKDVGADEIDALVFPGGFGAAKNLCTFAFDGVNCKVNSEVDRLIREMHSAGKPQGFICIAPVIAAKVLGSHQPELTIGNDAGTASAIEEMGGKHLDRPVDDCCVDHKNKIVTTPAYMLGPSISEVAKGIGKCVRQVLDLA